MKNHTFLSALGVIAALSHNAHATEFNQFQPAKSVISFVFKQMNVPVEGQFKRINGQLSIDPAKPVHGRAEIELDLNGIDAGSSEATHEVAGKLWFNTKIYPTARFVTTSVKPISNNRFEVKGTINLKGKTRDIVTVANFRQEGKLALFEGSFFINRADFSIGEGLWADFGTVANEVHIRFRLAASATEKR